MINLNLRQAVIYRVQDKSADELNDIIVGTIGGTDQALPALGVLFELIWQNSKPEVQQSLVATLKEHMPHVSV